MRSFAQNHAARLPPDTQNKYVWGIDKDIRLCYNGIDVARTSNKTGGDMPDEKTEIAEQMQALNRETIDGNNSIEYENIGAYIELAEKLAHLVIVS